MVSLFSVFVGLYDSIKKNIFVLDTVLPGSSSSSSSFSSKNLSDFPKLSVKESGTTSPKSESSEASEAHENSKFVPVLSNSTTSTHSDEALFPSLGSINNEIFQEAEFTQCSNQHTAEQLAKMIRIEKNQQQNTMDFKFDFNSQLNADLKASEFLNTPSPSSVDHTGYGSSVSSNSSLNNYDENLQHRRCAQTTPAHGQDEFPGVPPANTFIFGPDMNEQQQNHLPTPPTVSPSGVAPATITTTTKSLTKPVTTKNKEKAYICEYCGSEFKIRGYLTRHIKKHAINKAYECPFYDENAEHKCHPNGGFSRRDTYKTHLKSRHFKYPKGTKLVNRLNLSGSCGLCGEFFDSSDDWIEHHIENAGCSQLPQNYQVRVKNSRNKFYEFPNLNRSSEQVLVSPVSNTDLSSTGASPNNAVQQNATGYDQQVPYFQQQSQQQLPQLPQLPQQLPYMLQAKQELQQLPPLPQMQIQPLQQLPSSASYTSLNSFASSQSSTTALLNSFQATTANKQAAFPQSSSDNLEELYKHFNYAPAVNQAGNNTGVNFMGDFNDDFSLDVESSVNYSQFNSVAPQ
ncbi:hypothetical protein WICPIJ_008276 [Wickerhamomyces pijperi]|uniref:C2H2-type domain-containing protein n=1 Tax=Wickerhamomyces pijperi TaxID=599730 RepID=A0A9P8PXQ0_WICPI|nr:hypothetical protein WICPIJ_008276 [Wickerhamomyces pijperi]